MRKKLATVLAAVLSLTSLSPVSAANPPQVVATVAMPAEVRGIAVNSSTHRAYVAVGGPGWVPSTYKAVVIEGTVKGVEIDDSAGDYSTGPIHVALNPVTNRLYVNHTGSNFASVIDTARNLRIGTLATGAYPDGIAADPTRDRLYIANTNSGNVYVINTANDANTRLATIALPGTGAGVTNLYLALIPAMNRVFVTASGINKIFVIDGATNAISATYSVAGGPRMIAADPSRNRLYVGLISPPSVLVMDATNGSVIASVPLGVAPQGVYAEGVAVDPTVGHVYATKSGSSELWVIDSSTNTVVGTVDVGSVLYWSIAVDTADHLVYVATSARTVKILRDSPAIPAATATSLTSSLNPSISGRNVTFTATVTSSSSPVTAGQVQFKVDGANTGLPQSLSAAGAAMYATSTLAVGGHTIAANYLGTPSFAASTGSLTQTVNPAPTSFAVNSSADLADASPGDGGCATSTGVCTLRAAVQEANALTGAKTITFAGSLNATPITLGSQLVVTNTAGITVTGNGADNTIVQACNAGANPSCLGVSRIFYLQSPAKLVLNGVTVRNGRATDAQGGGGIRVGSHLPWDSGYPGPATLILNDSVIRNNTSAIHGGGIATIGNVTVNRSLIVGNSTANGGGGILNSSNLTITDSTLSGNVANSGGGVFNNSGSLVGDVTITGSTIAGNVAAGWGGGVFNNGYANQGTFWVTNSTFSGNSAAGVGGAILTSNGPFKLASVTLSGNIGGSGAGAIASHSNSWPAPVTLTNTIVANSTGGNCSLNGGGASITSQGYNLIDDASCGLAATGDVNGNPNLGPLADNGGLTMTHALLAGSPAIDAGNAAGCTDASSSALATDQRGAGFLRSIDGNGNGVARCDIGAFEGAVVPLDTTPPTISVPADVNAYTDANACVATVSDAVLGTATATDNSGQVTVIRTGVPDENRFPLGETTVTYTATDAVGNLATATQTVTVEDRQPPAITAPSAVNAATGPDATGAGTVVGDAMLGTASASDNCAGPVNIARSGVPDGNFFPIGTTTITYTATDAAGNQATATQTVTVIDDTPPVVTVPAAIMADATSADGAVVSYTASAADNSGTASLECLPVSGGTFAIGDTPVTCAATDSAGNSASASFTVTVLGASEQLSALGTSVVGLGGGSFAAEVKSVEKALAADNIKAACGSLKAFANHVRAQSGKQLTVELANRLLGDATRINAVIGC